MDHRLKRSFFYGFIFVILGLALNSGLARLKKKQARKEPDKVNIQPVRVKKLKFLNEPFTITAFGNVRSKKSVTLPAEVSGRVTLRAAALEPGIKLKKDEILARIDRELYQFQFEKAEARLDKTRSELEMVRMEIKYFKKIVESSRQSVKLVKKDLKRHKVLLKDGASSQSQCDSLKNSLMLNLSALARAENDLFRATMRARTAKAGLKDAEVGLKEARWNLDHSVIRAPFDCMVTYRNIEEGDYINRGSPVATLIDPEDLEIPVQVRASDLPYLLNKNNDISITGQYIKCDVSIIYEFPGRNARTIKARGQVVRYRKSIDPQTRCMEVVVRPIFASTDTNAALLVPGMFTRVELLKSQ
ncbi:efflux RND transporter periplasmic adaptor subunit [Candidatus Riflebacteria bacterium]